MGSFLLSIISACAFAAVLYFNATLGSDTGSISDLYSLCITPPGWSFAIWAVIYVLLLIFVILLFLKPKIASFKLHILFWISSALNIGWIYFFSERELYIQAIAIIGLLVVLFMMLLELPKEEAVYLGIDVPRLAIGIYFGWICAATSLAVSMVVKYEMVGWLLDSQHQFYFCSTLVVVMLAVIILSNKADKNYFVPLPVIWALAGIISKNWYKDTSTTKPVFWVSWGAAIVLALWTWSMYSEPKWLAKTTKVVPAFLV
eukprot:gnl/Dysnectes_brevis/2609_a3153_1319.p1 GENE.gnl/Dysnectes_brevis/2609_a3153_1319~~gnl/Dysnectes_brevis/2609_a3153_1319.p1  ORF type:complete len:259 (+),score=56.42 gnl/Dysnectes_brevis/2609_a3153_1319:91-867(+)